MRFELTGSWVYGPITDDSDLDIIMYEKDHSELEKWLKDLNVPTIGTELQLKKEYSGYYFILGNIKINIIHVDDEIGMDAWAYATTAMKKIKPIEDREQRIAVFTGFRDAFYNNTIGE